MHTDLPVSSVPTQLVDPLSHPVPSIDLRHRLPDGLMGDQQSTNQGGVNTRCSRCERRAVTRPRTCSLGCWLCSISSRDAACRFPAKPASPLSPSSPTGILRDRTRRCQRRRRRILRAHAHLLGQFLHGGLATQARLEGPTGAAMCAGRCTIRPSLVIAHWRFHRL
jgi:hypothetical protein